MQVNAAGVILDRGEHDGRYYTGIRRKSVEERVSEHANGAQRKKILGDAPFSQILKGLAGIRRIVKAEEARLAYERANPGILPAE